MPVCNDERRRSKRCFLNGIGCALLLLGPWLGPSTHAGDRVDYNQVAAQRYVEMFHAADRNDDAVATRAEVGGNVELQATFDDIDMNRDARVTWAELQRYVDFRFR